jgi:hypothetical protein
MKRLILPLVGICLLLAACGGGADAEARAKAQAKADARKVGQLAWKDLSYKDTVAVDSEHVWNYVFYSTGWKPVRIKQALSDNSDCVCEVPALPVPIGEQDTIKVRCKFPQAGYQGITVTVEHDAPQPETILILFATAVEE